MAPRDTRWLNPTRRLVAQSTMEVTTAPDWAVSVARNREGLLLQPWAVLAPALLLVAFGLAARRAGKRPSS